MNASSTWLDAWKAKAERRRQRLAQALTRKPINPAAAAIRERFMKQAQTALTARKNWADAYGAHVKELANTLSKPSTATARPGSKGSLGDAG
jgi:hypothetical protein